MPAHKIIRVIIIIIHVRNVWSGCSSLNIKIRRMVRSRCSCTKPHPGFGFPFRWWKAPCYTFTEDKQPASDWLSFSWELLWNFVFYGPLKYRSLSDTCHAISIPQCKCHKEKRLLSLIHKWAKCEHYFLQKPSYLCKNCKIQQISTKLWIRNGLIIGPVLTVLTQF